MQIFVDRYFKCHTAPGEGLREFEVEFFDGKCARFIEGYRYIPEGETWIRSDGEPFAGEMLSPARDYSILAAVQAQYEEMQPKLEDAQAALEAIYSGEV